jgi:hypothetical protein
MKLTKRGKRLRALLIALLVALIWLAGYATTPAKCKVPADQMDNFCKELIFTS